MLIHPTHTWKLIYGYIVNFPSNENVRNPGKNLVVICFYSNPSIMLKLTLYISFACLICTFTLAQSAKPSLSVPGKEAYTHIDAAGISVLPSGRYITPAGQTIRIAHSPFGMAVSPDGTKTVVLHNGVFTVIDNNTMKSTMIGWIGDTPAKERLDDIAESYRKSIPSPLPNGSFLGVAFGSDNKTVFLSGGDNGSVIVYDIEKFKKLDSISLNASVQGVKYGDSFTSDLKYNYSKNELIVLDRGNFRMVRIDLNTLKITASIPTGRQPFGLALSPDHQLAFVANVGMYDYPYLPDLTKENYDTMLLPWHPYGNGTAESINGTKFKGRIIPGVGSPLAPEAMSLYEIDLANNKVTDRYKPGYQIGEMIEGAEVVGGASPKSIAVGAQYAYDTNATNDNISVIDYRQHKIITHIPVTVDSLIDQYRGLLPFGIALSADEKTLYAALLGFNAVAVIDIETKKTKGLIPTGWGPTRVSLTPDGKDLLVVSCRGYGAGPNGGKGFVAPAEGTYIGDIQQGTFQKIPIPDTAELATLTKQVLANTFTVNTFQDDGKNPLPQLPGLRNSPVRYIVYITKENRTYDEVH